MDTVEACCIDTDCTVRRTKDPLPSVVESTGGLMIKRVTSLDGSQVLTATTEDSWNRKLSINDRHARNEKYFFVKNDYIYTPNITWDAISVEAIFEDPEEVDRLNSCDDDKIDCKSAYDRVFSIPNYLDKALKDLVNESLLRYYHRYKDDMHPNKNPQS